MKNPLNACSHYIVVISIFSIVLFSCAIPIPGRPTASQVPVVTEPGPVTASGSVNGWLQIYFTDPTALHARDYEGGPDEILAAAIDQARLSVDVAAYSLNLWSIEDALIAAHRRGVVVRIVMESDNMGNQEVQAIKDAGITVVGDQHEGLMHNKFIVIDRSEVWTGSMNFTTYGTYEDNNNLIRIRSTQVAEDYTNVFNEMFEANHFGPDARAASPNSSLTIDGTPVEIYFSPEDGIAAHILTLLQSAQESIYFMAYSFTSNDIGNAIRQRAADGLTVSGVMDNDQINSSQGTEYDVFMQVGLNVRRDGNAGLMHHKVIIIDRKIVITGSYNFSNSAETSNDENVVIIHNAEVAAQYLAEFQRVYDQAKP